MTLKQAAQSALDVQDACNFSGILHSLSSIVLDVLWAQPGANSQWISHHPIIVMYMLKLAELGGWDSTLNPAYEPAAQECKALAIGSSHAR